jgi:predicted TIM-barrel fold metal-dependent hydrolase
MAGGAIDYWCNAFTPEYRALWDAAIGEQDLAVRVRRDAEDSFVEPAAFLARMSETGFTTVLLPSAEVLRDAGPYAYERYATPPQQVAKLAAAHPGRFAGLWTIDPAGGLAGVRRAAEALAQPDIIGLLLHTHSWDRAFDHRDLYPFYALAAEHDVPVVMQAGASGGPLPSECGRPVGIDRPAIFFGAVRFVLSHTGWPWTPEAIAMAYKHANVYLGTAAWPPNRWPAELVDFIAGAGQGKTLFGTGFPVTGHRKALARLADLSLSDAARTELLAGAARRVFTRIPGLEN